MDRFDRYWIGILVGLLLPAAFGLTYIEVMNLWYPLQTLQFEAGHMAPLQRRLSGCHALYPGSDYCFDVMISAAVTEAG